MADKVESTDRGMVRVLVYGTLKSEGTNAELMNKIRAKFIGFDYVTGPMRMLDLGPFPALFHKENGEITKCYGEVYSMSEEALAHLDFYEGHPNFFKRRKMWTSIQEKRVWVYFMDLEEMNNDKAGKELQSGMWDPSDDEREFWNPTT